MIFSKCETCGKRKFIVKHRRFYSSAIKTYLTSNKKMCRTCMKLAASVK